MEGPVDRPTERGVRVGRQVPRMPSSATDTTARTGTLPLPATRLIVGAMASRNVWIMSSRLPIQSAIITTGIMIVMNG